MNIAGKATAVPDTGLPPPTPADLAERERLRRVPERPWSSVRGPEPGIQFTLRPGIDARRIAELAAITGVPRHIDLERLGETRLEITLGTNRSRTRCEAPNVYGAAFTLIQDADAGVLFLDHTMRGFLHLAPDQLASVGNPPAFVATLEDSGEAGEIAGRHVRRITVRITSPQRVRWELDVCPDIDLRPFAAAMLCIVLACPTRTAGSGLPLTALADMGVPLGGRIFADTEAAVPGQQPITSFVIEGLLTRRLSDEEFALPPDFSDLRKPFPPIPAADAGDDEATDGNRQQADEPVPDMEGPTPGDIGIPPCLPSSYESPVAGRVEIQALRDVQDFLNATTQRLEGFSGRGGTITIDWLEQLRQLQINGNADGWYCLLHDSSVDLSDPIRNPGGSGWLDRLAEANVRRLLREGTLGGVNVSPTLLIAILRIFQDASIAPEERYERLRDLSIPRDLRPELREDYLNQKLAVFKLPYTSTTAAQSVLNDLVRWRLTDLRFSLDIQHDPIFQTLDFGNSGDIHVVIKPKRLYAHAVVEQWPGPFYGILAATGWAVCILIPALCWLMGSMDSAIALMAFNLDVFQMELRRPVFDGRVLFIADQAGVIRPKVSLSLQAVKDIIVMAIIPTILAQVVSLIVTTLLNVSSIVTDEIGSDVESALQDLLDDGVPESPPKFDPLPKQFTRSGPTSVPGGNLTLSAQLPPPAARGDFPAPMLTLSDRNVELGMEARTFAHLFDKAYGSSPDVHLHAGFAISQNFLNQLWFALWLQGKFRFVLPAADAKKVGVDILSASEFDFGSPIAVELFHAVPPRVALTDRDLFNTEHYAQACFDDARLCVRGSPQSGGGFGAVAEFRFAARMNAQAGFGALDSDTGKLDVFSPADRFCDLYVDRRSAELVDTAAQGVATSGTAVGKITQKALDTLQDTLRSALILSLADRDDAVIPLDKDRNSPRFQRHARTGFPFICLLASERGVLYTQWGVDGRLTTPLGAKLSLWPALSGNITCALARGFLQTQK